MAYEDYIRENLNNLGELEKNDFRYLSENISQYFSESCSEIQLNVIAQLFKQLSYDDFPSRFKLQNVQVKYGKNKAYLINRFQQKCFEKNGRLHITPILQTSDAEKFQDTSVDILDGYEDKDKWKHKIYGLDSYKKCDTYLFEDQCAVAIRNNEIINILNASNSEVTDMSLVLETIACGGRLIECYQSDFTYYIQAGFMPISACKWDDNRAPKAWIKANKFNTFDNSWKNLSDEELTYSRQDIIFMIHTGTRLEITFDAWIKEIGYSDSYEDAKIKQRKVYKELEGIKNGFI